MNGTGVFAGALSLGAALLLSPLARVAAAAPDPFAPRDSASSIPPGFHLVEGDILEPVGAPRQALSASTVYLAQLWPGGVVPYEFDENVSPQNQSYALAAMAQWQAIGDGTNVSFVPRSGQADFLHIQNSTVNNSAVGMQTGGQIVNIASWSSVFIVAHELGHALGYYHEQSRFDRDSYVVIHPENICQNCCRDANGNAVPCNSNFDVRPDMGREWGPYDFDSVMHYAKCAFSIGGSSCGAGQETITMRSGYEAWQDLIGQTTHLSKLDRMVMSFLYQSPDWRFVDPPRAIFTFLGTFLWPYPTWSMGIAGTPSGGTLWVTPGTYAAVGTYAAPMTIQAPLGGVTLQ